jgi:hypothetical protein
VCASKITLVAYNWEDFGQVIYQVQAGLLNCGRDGLCLRAYRASLRQNGNKGMLTTLHEHHEHTNV